VNFRAQPNPARLSRVSEWDSSAEGAAVGGYGGRYEEGDRAGADFGLGQCTGAWTATRWSMRFVWGIMILALLACGGFIPAFDLTGLGQVIAAMIVGDLAALAVTLMALPPSRFHGRLYRYEAGIVMVADWEAEPVVLRWADLATVSTRIASDDGNDYVSSCELRDRSGTTMTVGRGFRAGVEQVAATAERVLAPRLVPGLIARYDVGEPVTLGPVTIDQSGIGYTGHGRGPAEWRLAWAQVEGIDIRMHGHRVAVAAGTRHPRRIYLGGSPNEFLVRYLIEHAAAPHARVTSDEPAWDGETGLDEETRMDGETGPYGEMGRDREGLPVVTMSALDREALAGKALPARAPRQAGARSRTRSWRWPALIAIAVVVAEGAGAYQYAVTRPVPVTVTITPGIALAVSAKVESLAFTPDGKHVLAVDKSGALTEWGLATDSSTTLDTGTVYGVSAVAVGPDGGIAAADVSQIDRLNGVTHALESPLTVPDPADSPYVVAVSPNGKWVASGDWYGDVFLWTASTGTLRQLNNYPTGDVQAVAFSPDSATLAVGDNQGNIALWNVATGTLRGTLTDPSQFSGLVGKQVTGVTSLSFSDRGSLLAASDANGSVYLWDAGGQSLVATLTGNDLATTAALSPDGRVVAAGTSGGETYLWDVGTGKLVDSIGSGGSPVGTVAFSPDGTQLAISAAGTITLWGLDVRSR
jgi:WD domain, G-beta repeat